MSPFCKVILAAVTFFFFYPALHAQKSLTCADIHQGIFYNYPQNSDSRYVDIREGDYAHETDVTTGDTSLWKIKWNDDCTYTLSLVDMNGKNEEQTRKLMKKHKLVFTINKLTDDYYTYSGYLDKPNSVLLSADTMWLHEKVNITDNHLIEIIHGTEENKAFHISDTAKYALLYIYRPGKVTLSMANYLLYFNNNLIGVAKNNSGLLFKVLKEGIFQLKSRLNKDESTLPLTIQFGKAYYIKTSLQWGMYKHLSNYKLQNEAVTAEQGQAEFQSIRHF